MKHLTFCVLLGLGMHMLGFGQTYSLTVESSAPAAAPGTVYRFYVNSNDPTDKISAVFGNDQDTLSFSTPEGIFNSALNSSWNASGINPALFGFFPDLQDDSYATIGLDGPAANVAGSEDPSLVQDASLMPTVSGYFQAGGTGLEVNTLTGASWYVLNTAANALPDEDGRWLIAQITTEGSISGQVNIQVFPLGVGADQVQSSIAFDGAGMFTEGGAIVPGCTDAAACNFDPAATEDDGSCLGIPDGDCDCAGNTLDAVGVCGGTCMMDANANGICDDIEVEGAPTPLLATTTPTPTWTTALVKDSQPVGATATALCLTPTTTACAMKTKSTVATILLPATTIPARPRMTARASTALVPIPSTPCRWRLWKLTTPI